MQCVAGRVDWSPGVGVGTTLDQVLAPYPEEARCEGHEDRAAHRTARLAHPPLSGS